MKKGSAVARALAERLGQPCLSREDVLANDPRAKADCFHVQAVLD